MSGGKGKMVMSVAQEMRACRRETNAGGNVETGWRPGQDQHNAVPMEHENASVKRSKHCCNQ